MKKLVLLILLLLGFFTLSAQVFPKRGYRVFLEGGFNSAVGNFQYNRVYLSSSHGFQMNPLLFLGCGQATQFYISKEKDGNIAKFCEPVFADIRLDFIPQNVTPFFDFRLGGAFMGEVTGFHMSITGGVRAGRCNFSTGYEVQYIEDYSDSSYDGYEWGSKLIRRPAGAIVFKFAFDLGARR